MQDTKSTPTPSDWRTELRDPTGLPVWRYQLKDPLLIAELEAYIEDAKREKVLYWKKRDEMFGKWYGQK